MPLESNPEIKDVYIDKITKPQPDHIPKQHIILNQVKGMEIAIDIGATDKHKIQKKPMMKKAMRKASVEEEKSKPLACKEESKEGWGVKGKSCVAKKASQKKHGKY